MHDQLHFFVKSNMALLQFTRRERQEAFAYGMDGVKYLFFHCDEAGRLSIAEEALAQSAPDVIICCYPKRASEKYGHLVPGAAWAGARSGWDTRLSLTIISDIGEGMRHLHSVVVSPDPEEETDEPN